MTSINLLKSTFIASFLAASAIAGIGNAAEMERGPDGLLKEPICDYDFTIKRSLSVQLGETPTGIKASNDKWDMEVYADNKDRSWTLVGKSKEPNASSRKLCQLAKGLSNSPYNQEKWYTAYFSTPDANKPKIAAIPQDPKPALN